MKKSALFGLSVLLLVSPAAGQRSPAIEARQLPTYVTQLGLGHYPVSGASHSEEGEAIVVLRSGAVLVAGRTYGSIGEPHAGATDTPDAFVARFDPAGNVEWIRQLGAITAATIPALNGNPAGPGGDASSWDVADDLAVAADGSIYVTGTTHSSLGETVSGSDLFLAKLDPHGSLQWVRQLGVETSATVVTLPGRLDASDYNGGTSILIDPTGAVYVAGNAKFDVFLARFSPDGRLEWLRQQAGSNYEGWEFSPEIAVHPSGSIVLACTTEYVDLPFIWDYYVTLFTFDPHGTLLASKDLPSTGYEEVGGLAVDDSSGKIFLAGHTGGSLGETNGGGLDAFVAKFDVDLELEWIRQLGKTTAASLGLQVNTDDYVAGLCIDRAGDLILAGFTYGSLAAWSAGGTDIFTAKLNGSDGQVLWVSQIGDITSTLHGLEALGNDWARDLALGPRGTIAITGGTSGNLAEPQAGSSDVIVMRLTPKGEL